MFYVYVVRSESSKKIYIGQTSDLDRRLKQHNDPCNDFSEFTKKNKGPWKLLYKEVAATRADALRREKFLKSGQGRNFIKLLLGSSAGRAGGC
ncbi:MAG: GIY-YIG nuclease family protein [Nitrospirota bacterium]